MTPLVSVIIPTYNRQDLVQLAIDSVLEQTFVDFEIIVIDDGSTDGTEQALQRYGNAVRYIYQDNQGESSARNRGIEVAQGEYIAFLDSDDLWLPHKLERQMKTLADNPRDGLVFGQALLMDSQGNVLPDIPLGYDLRPEELTVDRLLVANFVAGSSSSVVVRRADLLRAGLFDESIRFAEDWELWIRLALSGCEFRFIREPLAIIRVRDRGFLPHPEDIPRMLREHLSIVEKSFASLPQQMRNLQSLKPQAMAGRYGWAALCSYAYGRMDEGRQFLSRAAELDPATWLKEEHFRTQVVDFAWGIMPRPTVETVSSFVIAVYGHLPANLVHLLASRRKALAHAYVAGGFKRYRSGYTRTAGRLMARAITMDPHWLANRGVVSVLLRSFLG